MIWRSLGPVVVSLLSVTPLLAPPAATQAPAGKHVAVPTILVHAGFFEREIHRVTHSYGRVVHAFSTYEERRAADGPVVGRGINSIELFWDGTRWWIASAVWFDEDAQHPIPPEYLP